MPLAERLGALRERDFRLLFAGTMITTVGDRLAGIALAFAVLDIASATVDAARLRPRGPARRRDRDHRDALDRGGRDVGVVGGDPGTAVRLGDPRQAAGVEPEPRVTTIGAP
jgi:hypothetical protein